MLPTAVCVALGGALSSNANPLRKNEFVISRASLICDLDTLLERVPLLLLKKSLAIAKQSMGYVIESQLDVSHTSSCCEYCSVKPISN
jgi:hypothetical protein